MSLALAAASDRELRWAVDGGLGPLLHRAIQAAPERITAARREMLHGADLTARIVHGTRVDCAVNVIDTCARLGVVPTLLKGISISEQHYPTGHWRPMSDIDILAPAEAYADIETELLASGFTRSLDGHSEDSHHGPPLYDAGHRVWVELHRQLFPKSSGLQQGMIFSPEQVAQSAVASTFRGRPVRRLNNELQLVYVAASWIWDITLCKIHPTFLPALFDLVYLNRSVDGGFNWEGILSRLDNETAVASTYTLLSWLQRNELIDCPILLELARRQTLSGPFQHRLMQATIDRYLVSGRPWNLPLPPPVPGRYNLRRQVQKRLSQ